MMRLHCAVRHTLRNKAGCPAKSGSGFTLIELMITLAIAAVLLVVAVLLSGTPPWPRTAISWLPLLGMAVGPTVVGHTMLNWALAHLEAYRVNLAVLLEPVGATLLTWALLGETPPLHVVPGAALVLGGLVLEMLPRRSEAAG